MVFCVGRWSGCCSFISWVVRWFVRALNGSFVRSLGTGGRPLIRFCSFGAGEVRSFFHSFIQSFVLSSVLPFGGSFVPHIGCTVVFLLVEQEKRKLLLACGSRIMTHQCAT